MPQREHISRRHLPHWYVPGAAHFVTYRLTGTLPAHVLQSLRANKESRLRQGPEAGANLAQFRDRIHKQFFAAYDRYLDELSDIDWLANPPLAALVRSSLYYHNGGKYYLLAYCIMPNHVHVLLQPTEACAIVSVESKAPSLEVTGEEADEVIDSKSPLAAIMHSLKSYTANRANQLLEKHGPFWQHESYDHWVRDEQELERIVDYIAANPVKAKRVKEPQEWFFCSAHDRFLQDGSKSAWLGDISQPS